MFPQHYLLLTILGGHYARAVPSSIKHDVIIISSGSLTSPDNDVTIHEVHVGQNGLNFEPFQLSADVGDEIKFIFHSTNHSVSQSSLGSPCVEADGYRTGFKQFNPDDRDGITSSFTINDLEPQYFFCHQTLPVSHCHAGMVFALNPGDTTDTFLNNTFASDVCVNETSIAGSSVFPQNQSTLGQSAWTTSEELTMAIAPATLTSGSMITSAVPTIMPVTFGSETNIMPPTVAVQTSTNVTLTAPHSTTTESVSTGTSFGSNIGIPVPWANATAMSPYATLSSITNVNHSTASNSILGFLTTNTAFSLVTSAATALINDSSTFTSASLTIQPIVTTNITTSLTTPVTAAITNDNSSTITSVMGSTTIVTVQSTTTANVTESTSNVGTSSTPVPNVAVVPGLKDSVKTNGVIRNMANTWITSLVMLSSAFILC